MLMPVERHCFMRVEQMLGEVIDLYREYVERHGYPPEQAKAAAVAQILEGARVDINALRREMTQ